MDDDIKALIEQEKTKYFAETTTPSDFVNRAIYENAIKTNDVKDVVDLATTARALQEKDTVDKLSTEKTEELVKNAEAKKIKAETEKIHEETQKIKHEADQIAVEKEKAQAYFDANKEILKCVGIRNALTLNAMKKWFVIACVIYGIFQFILLPVTLTGFAVESIVGAVGAVCGSIVKQGVRIFLSILVTVLILGVVFFVYYLIVNNLIPLDSIRLK